MSKWLQAVVAAAVLLAAMAFAALCWYLAWAAQQYGEMAQAVTADAAMITADAHKTLDRVNAPCDPAPCGTLADLHRTLATVRGAAGQVEAAGRANSSLSADLHNTQVELQKTLESLSKTADAGSQLAQDASEGIRAGKPTLDALPAEVRLLHSVLGHADALIADPANRQTIEAVSRATENMATVTDNAAKVTTHFEKEIDTPAKHHWWTPIKTIWGITWQALMLVK